MPNADCVLVPNQESMVLWYCTDVPLIPQRAIYGFIRNSTRIRSTPDPASYYFTKAKVKRKIPRVIHPSGNAKNPSNR